MSLIRVKAFHYEGKEMKALDDNRIVDLYLSRDEAAISQTSEKYGSRLAPIEVPIVEGGKFTIETVNNSDTNIYIKSISLNGKPHKLPYIKHSDIAKGGTLTIEMSDTPTKWW